MGKCWQAVPWPGYEQRKAEREAELRAQTPCKNRELPLAEGVLRSSGREPEKEVFLILEIHPAQNYF